MINLKIGDKAPDFELMNQEGKKVKLSDSRGKRTILYFYPKDNTSGCTKEACDFRDNISKLKKLNAEVLGVSNDDEASHKNFADEYGLPFGLLCDVDKEVSKKYGVYELKEKFGKEYYGITRSTFIIDENGKIERIFYRVNPDMHIGEVLQSVKGKH